LVPLVWESNPKLQGGWCKPNHQPREYHRPGPGPGARGHQVSTAREGVWCSMVLDAVPSLSPFARAFPKFLSLGSRKGYNTCYRSGYFSLSAIAQAGALFSSSWDDFLTIRWGNFLTIGWGYCLFAVSGSPALPPPAPTSLATEPQSLEEGRWMHTVLHSMLRWPKISWTRR